MTRPKFSKEYRQLLKSPQWAIIRAKVFKRDNYTCKRCKKYIPRPTKTLWLECDHRRYPPPGAPLKSFLDQPFSDYDTLCCRCHPIKTKESRK